MRLLLDTHVLIWAASEPSRLAPRARALFEDRKNTPIFSVASLWEIAIKASLPRRGFVVDARLLRRTLIANDFEELEIKGDHVLAVSDLPAIHGDPFDRLLVAQAIVEGLVLVTSDKQLTRYPGAIRKV